MELPASTDKAFAAALAARRPPQRRWSDGPDTGGTSGAPVPWSMAQHWPVVLGTLAEQAADCTGLLLGAVRQFAAERRIAPDEARVLAGALEQLQAASRRAQQITRLAGGRIRQARDHVDLAAAVRSLLRERRAALDLARVEVRTSLAHADVLLDPTTVTAAVEALLDWAVATGRKVLVQVEPTPWPGPARLAVSASGGPPPAASHGPHARRAEDGLHLALLRQIAAAAGLAVTFTRLQGAGTASIAIDFPKTFLSRDGMASADLLATDMAPTVDDAWVLVIASDPAVRAAATDALRTCGIAAKAVPDALHAIEVVTQARPSAVVVGEEARCEVFASMVGPFFGPDARCPIVELTARRPSFSESGFDRCGTAQVGREDLRKELGPCVLFEIAKLA